MNSAARRQISKLVLGGALMLGASVSAMAQDDGEVSDYRALLDRNHGLQLEIGYDEVRVKSQEEMIASLEAQLERADALKASINPLVARMMASYEEELKLDAPYNFSERTARLELLSSLMQNENASDSARFQAAMKLYEAEVNLGIEVDEYPVDNPDVEKAGWRRKACLEDIKSERCYATNEMRESIRNLTNKSLEEIDLEDEDDALAISTLLESFEKEDKLRDGNYLRVGRLALIYADIDGKDVRRYNVELAREKAAKNLTMTEDEMWIPVSGTSQVELFRAVKMAKGEAAVDVMQVPVEVAK